MRGKLLPAFLIAVMFAVVGTGYYIMSENQPDQNADSDPQLELIESTESYQNLAESGKPSINRYEVGEEEIEFAEEAEYPYNFSNSTSMSNSKGTLELATEFGDFSLTQSTLIIANSSSEAYIYQVKNGRLLNQRDGRELYNNYIDVRRERIRREQEAERNEMCQEVSLRFYDELMEETSGEPANYTMPSIGVWNVGNTTYEGTTEMIIFEKDGEKHQDTRYNGFPAGSGYNFEFEDIESVDTVKNITLNPEECPTERQTVRDLS